MTLSLQTPTALRLEEQQDVGWLLAFVCVAAALWSLRVVRRDRKKHGLGPAHFATVIALVAGAVVALALGTTHTIVTLDRAEARVVARSALGFTSREDAIKLEPLPEVKIQFSPHAANRGRPWERVSLVRGNQEFPLTDFTEDFDEVARLAQSISAWLTLTRQRVE